MAFRDSIQGMNRIYRYLAYHRLVVVVATLVLTGIFLYGAFQIRGEVILQDLFPYDHPYLKLHARFSQIFGSGGSGAVIALKAKNGDIFNEGFLARLRKINDEVDLWEEVYRNLTISIASRSAKVVKARGKGEITIEPLMWPNLPQNPQEMDSLKRHIFSDASYNGILVSKDGTAALLFTEFKENISYLRAFQLLRKVVRDYSDGETSVHIVGYPMLMGWIYSLKPQMYMVFAISIAGMIVVLYLMFRNVTGMVSPMANALFLTIMGLGFIGFTGINFNPMLYVLAFLVGARMVSNSVQITYRYFEELHASGGDRFQASYETMRTMLFPNWAGVATDTAGFVVLALAKIVLMQNLAIIMGFWMTSIGITGFLVPTVCSLIPLKVASERWAKENSQMDWLARGITNLARYCIGSPGRYVFSAVIIACMVLFSWQISKVKIGDPTPGSPILWPYHTYNKDQQVINQHFNASSENFMLFYEGEIESVNDPIVLTMFEDFSRYMKGRLPDIYKSSSSYIDIVQRANMTLHDGNPLWGQLPRNKEMLYGLMGYLRISTAPSTFERFIDEGRERSQITLYFADHTSENLLRIRNAAYDFFKDRPMQIEKGEFKLAGGRIGMEIALNEEMKRSHGVIDTTVLAGIFILITISFMSITGGLMVTLPLLFANSMAFAYMAFTGIGLSIDTLPVAAVGVGVGDDFCIYMYSRCMEEYPLQGGDWTKTIIQSVCTCGKAIVYTGLTIILPIITWYIFSDMKFQAQVGFFLAIIMGATVILAVTLHPLLIYIIKPKFISRKNKVLAAGAKEISV